MQRTESEKRVCEFTCVRVESEGPSALARKAQQRERKEISKGR
jgi:hypothetical protein